MKMITVILSLLFSLVSFAQVKGFVEIRKGLELYVDYVKAQEGKPTVVLLNGLTYSTQQWDSFAEELVKRGIGVVRYDMQGMGETLLKYAPIVETISIKTQTQNLKALLTALKIPAPYNLIGLSYGGGVAMEFAATYPTIIDNLMIMAPYTQPQKQQDDWIQSQIWLTRKVQPWNKYTDDELYDYFLRQIVYSTYPQAEPVILENPYKLEAVYQMIKGIRKWKAANVVDKLPAHSLHLMIAGSDQYITRDVLLELWNSTSKSTRESLIVINNTEHKIPEAVPVFASAWVNEILNKNVLIKSGREFEADPFTGVVRYEGGKFKIK